MCDTVYSLWYIYYSVSGLFRFSSVNKWFCMISAWFMTRMYFLQWFSWLLFCFWNGHFTSLENGPQMLYFERFEHSILSIMILCGSINTLLYCLIWSKMRRICSPSKQLKINEKFSISNHWNIKDGIVACISLRTRGVGGQERRLLSSSLAFQ